jgi:hypothetical protein
VRIGMPSPRPAKVAVNIYCLSEHMTIYTVKNHQGHKGCGLSWSLAVFSSFQQVSSDKGSSGPGFKSLHHNIDDTPSLENGHRASIVVSHNEFPGQEGNCNPKAGPVAIDPQNIRKNLRGRSFVPF